MLKRWHHGHSIVAGIVAGASLTQGVWGAFLLFAGGLLVGLVVGLVWHRLHALTGWLVQRARRRDGVVTMRTWRRARRELFAIRPDDEVPF